MIINRLNVRELTWNHKIAICIFMVIIYIKCNFYRLTFKSKLKYWNCDERWLFHNVNSPNARANYGTSIFIIAIS